MFLEFHNRTVRDRGSSGSFRWWNRRKLRRRSSEFRLGPQLGVASLRMESSSEWTRARCSCAQLATGVCAAIIVHLADSRRLGRPQQIRCRYVKRLAGRRAARGSQKRELARHRASFTRVPSIGDRLASCAIGAHNFRAPHEKLSTPVFRARPASYGARRDDARRRSIAATASGTSRACTCNVRARARARTRSRVTGDS